MLYTFQPLDGFLEALNLKYTLTQEIIYGINLLYSLINLRT